MAQFGFDFYKFDIHRFDQTPITKVIEEAAKVLDFDMKRLSKEDIADMAATIDRYILTVGPRKRDYTRIAEEMVWQLLAKRKTEAVIREEFQIKKTLMPAYVFVGVDGVRAVSYTHLCEHNWILYEDVFFLHDHS